MGASRVRKVDKPKKVTKKNKRSGGKDKKPTKPPRCPAAERPALFRCPFSVSPKLHPKFAAMLLDCTCSGEQSWSDH